MSSARISFFQRWNWRTLAFVIVDGLLVVFLLYEGALALLAPWVLLEPAPLSYSPQFVRWYVAQMGALACIGTLLTRETLPLCSCAEGSLCLASSRLDHQRLVALA